MTAGRSVGTMESGTPDVIICGAGIAGVSTAYHLAVTHGISRVLLVDERTPLSLTSDKSTECYRNWWPGPDDAMIRMMTRSIDILEELADVSHNICGLNRRGYVFATADPDQADRFARAGERAESMGAGPLRVFAGSQVGRDYKPALPEGYHGQPEGADLLLGSDLLGQVFPYLSPETTAALHIRRAGWLSAQQLGSYMLQQAQEAGVQDQPWTGWKQLNSRAARSAGWPFAGRGLSGHRFSSTRLGLSSNL